MLNKEQQLTLMEKHFTGMLNTEEQAAFENLLQNNTDFAAMVSQEETMVTAINDWGKTQLLARLDVIHEEVSKEFADNPEWLLEENEASTYSLNQLLEMFKEPELVEVLRSGAAADDEDEDRTPILLKSPEDKVNLEDQLDFEFTEAIDCDLKLTITNYQKKVIYEMEIPANTLAFNVEASAIENLLPGRYEWTIEAEGWRNARKFKAATASFYYRNDLNPYS